MISQSQLTRTFPSVTIPSQSGGVATEVSLIAQLGHGAGNHLFASVASRQRQHAAFVDELDEPSAKLGGADFAKDDPTSLYSFIVGPKGHPFHRHAGHRVFTAVSGSGGAQLRFSTATPEQVAADPRSFLRSLRYVNIPPDCLFAVRFGGETWHQFAPLRKNALHPVFFALSTHTNELGGNLSDELKRRVLANDANIPSLTELLPQGVADLLGARDFDASAVLTTTLSLDAPEGTFHRLVCNTVRGGAGALRGAWGVWKDASGYAGNMARPVAALAAAPETSLLRRHLSDKKIHHDDTFCIRVAAPPKNVTASQLLASVLEGFLLNAPHGVTSLMAFRNMLVKPLGLRTSPLGCPVSSLLSPRSDNLFAGQYPVIDQSVDDAAGIAQVILGADDKHLSFRSCVGVALGDSGAEITLGTRVHCKNAFGRFYMAAIDLTHRHYVTPAMLRRAVDYAIPQS